MSEPEEDERKSTSSSGIRAGMEALLARLEITLALVTERRWCGLKVEPNRLDDHIKFALLGLKILFARRMSSGRGRGCVSKLGRWIVPV
jgi:hypothetical protein